VVLERLFVELDRDIVNFLVEEKFAAARDQGGAGGGSFTRSGTKNSLTELQVAIHALPRPISAFIELLRAIHGTSIVFEGVLVPTIAAMYSETSDRPESHESEYSLWWKFWLWGQGIRQDSTVGQAKKEYVHAIRILRGLLEKLNTQVLEASIVLRDLDSGEMLVVKRAVRRFGAEEEFIAGEEAEDRAKNKWKLVGWVLGRLPKWVLALWDENNSRAEQSKHKTKLHREQELVLFKRAKELSEATSSLLPQINEMLKDREAEATELAYYVDENSVQGVLNGSMWYKRHMEGLVVIASRHWTMEVVKRGWMRIKGDNNTI
jgi:hypothetical protein